MKIINILLIIAIFFCFSCEYKESNYNLFSLRQSEISLSFPIDESTKTFIQALFIWEDENKNEYLTFQNQGKNEILFYNIKNQELMFKIKPDVSGNNGVGFFIGYYIHTLDSIFLTIQGVEEIALIDQNANLKSKLSYEETDSGINLRTFYSGSFMYHPIVIIENDLYIMPGCNRWNENNPVCATINLKNESVKELPFSYPSFHGADNKSKRASAEGYVSRCFDGNRFIYSFHFDESIYVTSIDHKSTHKISAKSKYINKVKMLDDYGNVTQEDACRNPNYGNLVYDKYRNVYYRICYPETEIEKGVRGMELLQYGRKNFSILILDENFRCIGETLFSDYTYNSSVLFISEDGLYISESHYLNPNYTDDLLTFRKFDLIKNIP